MWRNSSTKLPGRGTGHPDLSGRWRFDQPARKPPQGQRCAAVCAAYRAGRSRGAAGHRARQCAGTVCGQPGRQRAVPAGLLPCGGAGQSAGSSLRGCSPGETVLDLCAAPGGKTILLAEQMQGTGELYSCDAAENRVGLIRTAVDRMGFAGVHTLCNDATKPNPALPMADRILTDVPCSGLGILAKSRICAIKAGSCPAGRAACHTGSNSGYRCGAAQGGRAAGLLHLHHRPGRNQQQIAAFCSVTRNLRSARRMYRCPPG